MEKMTRRWKFESQIDNFKQLKSEADSDIKKVESLALTADYGIKWDIDNIVKKIVEVLNINQKKLRDDPEYQEAMKYRSKLIAAKKDYESASKEYQEKYEWEYNSKIREIDELRHDERTKSKQLEEEFNLWWPTLESARAQNWENFEKKIKTLREDSDYQDALSAKKNLIKLKLRLVEALKDYEKELDIDNEELSEKEEKNIVERRRKVRTIENVNKTLSNLWINSEKVDWVILPTSIDWKKIIKKNDSNDLQIIEEINYSNKVEILFSKVFDSLWFSEDDYNVIVWKTNKNMVRKVPYIVVEVPSINKTIIVNNLYWEATFLCDNIFENKEYLNLSKEDLLKKYPDTVTKLDFYDEDLWIEYIKTRLMTKNLIDEENREEQLNDVHLYPDDKWEHLSPEEINDLIKRYKTIGDKTPEGLRIRDKIINSNLGYVHKLAKSIYNWLWEYWDLKKVDLYDFIQAWSFWLVEAFDKYVDIEKNIPFLAFAANYIKWRIYQYIINDSAFFSHRPRGSAKQMRKMVEDFYQKNKREPTDAEWKALIDEYNKSVTSQRISLDAVKIINEFVKKNGRMPTETELQKDIDEYNSKFEPQKISNELKENFKKIFDSELSDYAELCNRHERYIYSEHNIDEFIDDFIEKHKSGDLKKLVSKVLLRNLMWQNKHERVYYTFDSYKVKLGDDWIKYLEDYIVKYNNNISKHQIDGANSSLEYSKKFMINKLKENNNSPISDGEIDSVVSRYNRNFANKFSDDYWKYYKHFLLEGVQSIDELLDTVENNWYHEVQNSYPDVFLSDENYEDNEILEDNFEATLKDIIYDSNFISNPEKKLIINDLKKILEAALDELPEWEKEILCLFFWLFWEAPTWVDEISEKFDIPRERVRLIKDHAIKRLRKNWTIKKLWWYLEDL